MVDPRPTTPTPELEQESPQEELDREQREESDDPELSARTALLRGLSEPGWLRYDELGERLDIGESDEEWRRRLWRLHNEELVKVRWVGMTDPDPVEVRITDRGREWLASISREPESPPPPSDEAGGA
ncbi:MAG: hypothetical protein ABR599_02335 [Gemmatimonadota bacterium]